MKKNLLVLLVMMSLGGSALAQTACPQGVAAGSAQCGPSSSGFGASPPQPKAPHWRVTWGAIAMDETTGHFGETYGHFYKWKAKREALARCSRLGSKNCEIALAYKNQCAVIAWASEDGVSVGGPSIVQGGPTIQIASELAISACRERRGGKECTIVYSACTRSVLVQ